MSFLNQSLFFYLAMIYAFLEILDFSRYFKREYFDSHTKKQIMNSFAFLVLVFGILFFIIGNFFTNRIYVFFISFFIGLSLINFKKNKLEIHKNISKKIFIIFMILIFLLFEKMLPLFFYFNLEIFFNMVVNIMVSIAIGLVVFFVSSAIGKKHIVAYLSFSVIAFLFGEMLSKMGLFSVIIFSILNKNMLYYESKKLSKEILKQQDNVNFLKYFFKLGFIIMLIIFKLPLINPEIFMIVGVLIFLWFLFLNKTMYINFLPLIVLLYFNKNLVGFENYFLFAYSIIFYLYFIVLIINFKEIKLIIEKNFK